MIIQLVPAVSAVRSGYQRDVDFNHRSVQFRPLESAGSKGELTAQVLLPAQAR